MSLLAKYKELQRQALEKLEQMKLNVKAPIDDYIELEEELSDINIKIQQLVEDAKYFKEFLETIRPKNWEVEKQITELDKILEDAKDVNKP